MKSPIKRISLLIFAVGAVLLLSGCEALYSFNPEHYEALNKETVEACQKLKKTDMQEFCITSLAVNKRDYLICIAIIDQDGQDICYQKVALVEKDPYICENINSSYYKNKCLEALK